MLINLRNALMAGKRLPYDNEVEYLESTGTQWIDTGIVGVSEWHITAQGTEYSSASNCVIATKSNGGSFWGSFRGFNYWAVGSANDSTNYRITLPYTSLGAFVVNFNSNSVTFTDGVETATRNSTPNFSVSFYLFSTHNDGYAAKVKIYGCKVYQSGTLVRDYIPVRKGTVGYLYDRVTRKLFGNAGTGDFVLGQDVVPVEYLRGDGSSAIETDIQWQLKAAYTEVDFRMPDTRDSASRQLIGSSATSFNYVAARHATRADYFGFNAATNPLLELVSGTQYKGAAWYENDLYNFRLNDSVATYSTTVHGTAGSFCVFSVPKSSYEGVCFKGDISAVRIYADKSKVQLLNNLQTVRVGTDATSWNGAMMDVLTRRIYRNAGTGAFGYGNDLKYPIPAS